MSIRHINGIYLADTARVLGAVHLEKDANLWYGVSIRGDVAKITVGQGTNIQDNAVVHCDSGVPNTIGNNVTIGHGAIVHGQFVGDDTLIGMGAKVLGRTRIGQRCLIAAGAVVAPGTEVPDEMLVLGVPGRIVRPIREKERQYLAWLGPHYVRLARLHHEEPDNPRIRPWTANQD